MMTKDNHTSTDKGRLGSRASGWLVIVFVALLVAIPVVAGLVTASHRELLLSRHQAVYDYLLTFNEPLREFIFDQSDSSGEMNTVDMRAPATFAEAVDGGYIKSMPINPFTGEPASCLGAGDDPSPGDFTYIPARVDYPLFEDGLCVDDPARDLCITVDAAYYLIGWGKPSLWDPHLRLGYEPTAEDLLLLRDLGACTLVQTSYEPYQHDFYLEWESFSDAWERAGGRQPKPVKRGHGM